MNIKKLTTIILAGTIASQISSSTILAKELPTSFTLNESSIIYEENVNKVISFEDYLKQKEKNIEVSQNGIKYKEATHSISKLADILFNQDVTHKIYKNGYFANATKLEIAQHLMVEPRVGTPQFKYQFLRIDSYHNIDKNGLEKYLSKKGVFKGHAQDFIDAAKKYDIDPLYLVSHAMLESGNGTSSLAKGTEINGKIYYNFFGINAFDANPTYGGLSLAQKEDWSSVAKAIHGGANWISRNYLHSSKHNQKTIYNMRFNPLAEKPWHLYATDVRWADIISTIMNEISDLYVDENSFLFEPVKYI